MNFCILFYQNKRLHMPVRRKQKMEGMQKVNEDYWATCDSLNSSGFVPNPKTLKSQYAAFYCLRIIQQTATLFKFNPLFRTMYAFIANSAQIFCSCHSAEQRGLCRIGFRHVQTSINLPLHLLKQMTQIFTFKHGSKSKGVLIKVTLEFCACIT